MKRRLMLPILILLLPLGVVAQESSERQVWKEACRKLPELKDYRPLFLKPTPVDELMAWVPEGKTVRVYDENCKPIDLTRHEGRLAGDVEVKTTYEQGVKRVSARTAHFGLDVSYTGPGFTEYEKDAKGRWKEVGSGGRGCLDVRTGALGRVSREAAFYDGAVVSLKVVCGSYAEEAGICQDGKERNCKRCSGLQIQATSLSRGIGFGYARGSVGSARPGKPVDCSRPCPPDELTPVVEELNRTLEGKRFVRSGQVKECAALFRSLKACRRHRSL